MNDIIIGSETLQSDESVGFYSRVEMLNVEANNVTTS